MQINISEAFEVGEALLDASMLTKTTQKQHCVVMLRGKCVAVAMPSDEAGLYGFRPVVQVVLDQ